MTAIEAAAIRTTVEVDVRGQTTNAAVTRASVDELALAFGSSGVCLVTSTEVLLGVQD